MYEIKNQHNWLKNCGQNAKVILQTILSKGDDVLFLDADARVEKYPDLFDKPDFDIALHRINYEDRTEYCTGTLFFSNSIKSKQFLFEWMCENENGKNDQVNFENVMNRNFYEVADLPKEYCFIQGNRVQRLTPTGDVVIRHTQASRKYRKGIDERLFSGVQG